MKKEKEIFLTEEQKKGVSQIKEFLETEVQEDDINTKVKVIQGQAGTGKTFMLRHALEDIISPDRGATRDSINNTYEANLFTPGTLGCIGATVSHKAKKILSESIPIVTTYASYFGLDIEYDDFGNQNFVLSKNENKLSKALFHKPHLVSLHDEVSMYDDVMLNHVLQNVPFKTKVILVGDPNQLPPIKNKGNDIYDDSDSPAFTLTGNNIILTKKVRQTEGNPIINLSDEISKEIFGNCDLNRILHLMVKENIIDGKGYTTISYNDYLEKYVSLSEDYLDTKIIAYRNNRVNFYNNQIRNYIYGNPKFMYIDKELIYMNETFRLDNKRIFYNSDEYILEEISVVEFYGVECYQCFIDGKKYPHLENTQLPQLLIPTERGRLRYNEVIKNYDNKIRQEPPGVKRRAMIARKFTFINKFANVSYGYTLTAYKSQGSTFKNIFIDVNDIITLPLSNKRKLQALYTAITRASHKVYFLS